MRMFRGAFGTVVAILDSYVLVVGFWLIAQAYRDYADRGVPHAWRMFLFPSLLLGFFLAGAYVVLARRRDWGFALLVLPLFLPVLAELLLLDTSFVEAVRRPR